MPTRRHFLQAASTLPLFAIPKLATASPTKSSAAETAVKALYDSLTDTQKKEVCFGWDHLDKTRGLLRTHVENNWNITPQMIGSDFYTKPQRGIVADIFKNLVSPEWHERFLKQMKDDSGGKAFGSTQSLAIFGTPGSDSFEFVLTGRHQTIRADGNTEKHVAFGGPIFYGHAGKDDTEEAHHPDNVFWSQAVAANSLYKLLDGPQQKMARANKSPNESHVQFLGDRLKEKPGLPIANLTGDVKKSMQGVLEKLIEPFRTEDRDEVNQALKAQGGLDACQLTFFTDTDIGDDNVWDNWRIEGPSFVWYFRGSPHVHVWVNVADDARVKLNAKS
jgi:hypothetical protein